MTTSADTNGGSPPTAVDPVTGTASRPGGAGLYLHWEGRRSYRTKMPAPRVLEPLADLSSGTSDGNRVIEGDNLQVMVSLRSHYQGAVDVAYLDPPYNTGKRDFAYSDRRFHDPNADADDMVYVSNEDGGRHTKWLNYMGPRLWLTWQLLSPSGVCFVSINDVELFRLGTLMDEIFGEANRLGVLVWKSQTDNNPTRIAIDHEYILCYAKRAEEIPPIWRGQSAAKEWLMSTYERLVAEEPGLAGLEAAYRGAIKEHVAARKAEMAERGESSLVDLETLDRYNRVDERGPYGSLRHTENPRKGGYLYDVIHPTTGRPVKPPPKGYRFPEEKMRELIADDRIIFFKSDRQPVQIKKYLRDVASPLRSIIDTTGTHGTTTLKELLPDRAGGFPNPKPVELMEMLVSFAGDLDAVVLDPFAGSGTTGHAVMRLNARDAGARRFVLIEEGSREERYCRTLIAPRLQAAAEKENLSGGFTFETVGRRLDRDAIVELEREAIANLVIQTDATGKGRGIKRLDGEFLIGSNPRKEAICLCWNGRTNSMITREVLTGMFEEARERGLRRPLRVYGSTCEVGETETFRFCQIPDEILAALQLDDEEPDLPEEDPQVMERLEAATLPPDG